jgi:F-type H+-transporting ATPase subunit a
MTKENSNLTIQENKQEHSNLNQEQNNIQAQTQTENQAQGHAATEAKEESVFVKILGNIPDHDVLKIADYKICELPKIYIDNGFHFYWNYDQVRESGLYNVVQHKIHTTVTNKQTNLPPAVNLSITNFVVFQWVAIMVLIVIFNRVGAKYKKNPKKAPSGFQNAIEFVILYLRDDVVRPNIPSRKAADSLFLYFIALFFFVLFMNLTGIIPGGHTPTGALSTTGGLALISFLVINITAIKVNGIGAWLKHLTGGAPLWLAPIMIPIEIVGMLVKPFALTIRLFANMTAGHVVLLALLGILFFFNTLLLSPAITAFSIFIYALELLVAVIQAYLFTALTAIFVGLAIGHHEEEHAH